MEYFKNADTSFLVTSCFFQEALGLLVPEGDVSNVECGESVCEDFRAGWIEPISLGTFATAKINASVERSLLPYYRGIK